MRCGMWAHMYRRFLAAQRAETEKTLALLDGLQAERDAEDAVRSTLVHAVMIRAPTHI